MKNSDRKICANCDFWKTNQAELDYSKYYGICICWRWKFVTTDNTDIRVLDRGNLSTKYMKVHTFENQCKDAPKIGDVEKSRYCFVTNEDFGCVNHS
jgi:hypothetical protein